MGYKWAVASEHDAEKAKKLAESINVSYFLAQILMQRGITSFEEAKDFFRPSLEHLHDPYLMKDMRLAVWRLEKAIDFEEKILIYGDYDVDGTTSVALMVSFLSHFSSNVEYYIPDRYAEGYGVSMKGMDYAINNGFNLIITLDCGITAVNQIGYVKEHGVDVIICDHHTPNLVMPIADAILNPKQIDCEYPFKELSGCGVGFKLLQAYCRNNDIDEEALYSYLDLLAISIAADIVPIVGENRIFTKFGLDIINSEPRPGIKALKHASGFDQTLKVSDLVFGFAPRINAAGRLNHASQAVDILVEKSEEKALELSFEINKVNDDRKTFDKQILEEALSFIQNDDFLQNSKTTVLFNPKWHKGVVGIAASRCIEHYYRPTVILTESNGVATGSARSVAGFDVYEALKGCEHLLDQFGGHKYAAGLSVQLAKLDEFKMEFEKVVSKTIEPEQLIPKININAEVELEDINWKNYNVIKQMAPFGPGNMQPIFVVRGVVDSGYTKTVGEEEKHLKLSVKKGKSKLVDGIAFGMGDKLALVKSKKPFDMCFSIEENHFNGNVYLQLKIRDLKFGEG